MSVWRFLKYAAAAAGAQVALAFLTGLVFQTPAFLLIYLPWARLVEALAGPSGPGGHATGGAYLLGGLAGFVAYSAAAGLVACRLRGGRRGPP